MLGAALLCLLPLMSAPCAAAAITSLAESVRERGCPEHAPVHPRLRRVRELDAAARAVAFGASLHVALEREGYRASSSASIHIEGSVTAGSLSQVLAQRFCAQLTDPAVRDIGAYQRDAELWLIAAAPFAVPALSDPASVARSVLERVNGARAHGQRCGSSWYPPAPALQMSSRLTNAALEHSRDMAAHGYLDHTGHDGSSPAQRITRAGYAWRIVGENVASGPVSAAEVTQGWLASAAHCSNIMDPRFAETAVAFAVNPASPAGVYWTQVFAAARPGGAAH